MRKLNKNAKRNSFTVESMASGLSCECTCDYGFCTCASTTAFAGHYNVVGSYVYHAQEINLVVFG